MPTFSLECFQNEYLSPGADQVGAVVSVRAESAPDEGPSTGIGASIPAAGAPRTELIIIDVSGSMSGKKITRGRPRPPAPRWTASTTASSSR